MKLDPSLVLTKVDLDVHRVSAKAGVKINAPFIPIDDVARNGQDIPEAILHVKSVTVKV